jgi:nucleoside transporter
MNPMIRVRLSAMMFLEFFTWGAWFVSLGTFLSKNLNANGEQTGMVFSTQSWGAIIAPFIIGLIADRFIRAERILGFLHLAGAVLMYQMYNAATVDEFYPYVLGYMILFMPTLALVNSVSFNQLTNAEKQFSSIRVFGTIGWIVAGLLISYAFRWDNTEQATAGELKNTFLLAGGSSLLLGLFSFTLPATPPRAKGEKISLGKIIGLDALKLLKDRNFAIFFLASVAICIPLAFYYQVTNTFLINSGVPKPTGLMSMGQASEVLFMLLLPVFFTKYGFKKTILVGMLAWVLRYVLFAYGNSDSLFFMLILGIILHGVCYDFFFVSGQIYTDARAGEQYKSSAQGLITLATYGVGMLIGFKIAGIITDQYKLGEDSYNYQMIWLIPAGIAAAVFLLFALLFKKETKKIDIQH